MELPGSKKYQRNSLTLWYTNKARQNYKASISETLPVANKKLWARLFGGVKKEIIRINAAEDLPQNERFCLDLTLDFSGVYSYKKYIRELRLLDATATTEFHSGDTHFRRIAFAENGGGAFVMRLCADKSKKISFKLKPSSKKGRFSCAFSNDIMTVCLAEPDKILCFAVTVSADGGTICHNGNAFTVTKADCAVIYLTLETSDKKNQNERLKKAVSDIKKLVQKGYDRILIDHIERYQSVFNGFLFNINQNSSLCSTDKLLKKYPLNRNDLENLLFQYGRYINICSTGEDLSPEGFGGEIILGDYIKDLMPNLMSKISPFNASKCVFAAAGIRSLIANYTDGIIKPLPDKDIIWKNGYVSGLNVEDKFLVNIKWEDFSVKSISITSLTGESFELDVSSLGRYELKTPEKITGLKINDCAAHFDSSPGDVFEFFTNLTP